MSGETKEVFGSNYGQNDVIINGLIDKMTLFDDNLMSLVFGQNIETTELLLRVIMERDIKVIDVRGQDELKNPVMVGDVLPWMCMQQMSMADILISRCRLMLRDRMSKEPDITAV